MLKTNVRPSRDLRNNYREIFEMLKQHDHVNITNNGVGESVLINMDVYTEFEEYLHRKFIFEQLQKSKAKAAMSDVVLHNMDDVFDEI